MTDYHIEVMQNGVPEKIGSIQHLKRVANTVSGRLKPTPAYEAYRQLFEEHERNFDSPGFDPTETGELIAQLQSFIVRSGENTREQIDIMFVDSELVFTCTLIHSD